MKHRFCELLLTLTLFLTVVFVSSAMGAEPANWPGWRGPTGIGLAKVEIPDGWEAESALL